MKKLRSRLAGVLGPLVIAVGLGACEAPSNVSDPRQNFPIQVIQETVYMAISADANTWNGSLLGPADQPIFSQFIYDYHLRSSSPLGITVNSIGVNDADVAARVQIVRALLRGAGVRASEILVLPGATDNGAAATLSYTASFAIVPECEDWSSGTSFNWANNQHSNFGCATQRNLGLMVANPADLYSSQTMSNFDGERSNPIVHTYRIRNVTEDAPAAAAE